MGRYTFLGLSLFASSLFGLEEAPHPSDSPTSSSNFYLHPGIVFNQAGRWVGSDHLYNLPKKIAVIADVLGPSGASLPVDTSVLTKFVEDKFKAHYFDTTPLASSDKPALPFFNVLIVVYPIDQGYVALCEGRLFESIDPKRVRLEKGTAFQAITWEKKTLIVTPKDDFVKTVEKTIEDILNTFFERYDYFETLRLKTGEGMGVDRAPTVP